MIINEKGELSYGTFKNNKKYSKNKAYKVEGIFSRFVGFI